MQRARSLTHTELIQWCQCPYCHVKVQPLLDAGAIVLNKHHYCARIIAISPVRSGTKQSYRTVEGKLRLSSERNACMASCCPAGLVGHRGRHTAVTCHTRRSTCPVLQPASREFAGHQGLFLRGSEKSFSV